MELDQQFSFKYFLEEIAFVREIQINNLVVLGATGMNGFQAGIVLELMFMTFARFTSFSWVFPCRPAFRPPSASGSETIKYTKHSVNTTPKFLYSKKKKIPQQHFNY